MSSPPARFRAAVAQLCSTAEIEANLAACRELARAAADGGATLLALPECFAFLGRREGDKFAVAEPLSPERPGRILSTLMDIAQEHEMWIAGAGIPERIPEEATADEVTTAYNTLAVVSPAGELAATYRKIHLFDVDIPGKATLRESAATTAGRQVVSVETDLGVLGLSICYDLRFPELYQALTLDHGAQILLCPAAFTAHTGAAHWHVLLRARAIETQCYVIAPGQVGRHNEKRESFGHSLLVDPWGTVLAEVEEGQGVAIAEVDLAYLAEKRQQLPCLQHKVLGRP